MRRLRNGRTTRNRRETDLPTNSCNPFVGEGICARDEDAARDHLAVLGRHPGGHDRTVGEPTSSIGRPRARRTTAISSARIDRYILRGSVGVTDQAEASVQAQLEEPRRGRPRDLDLHQSRESGHAWLRPPCVPDPQRPGLLSEASPRITRASVADFVASAAKLNH